VRRREFIAAAAGAVAGAPKGPRAKPARRARPIQRRTAGLGPSMAEGMAAVVVEAVCSCPSLGDTHSGADREAHGPEASFEATPGIAALGPPPVSE